MFSDARLEELCAGGAWQILFAAVKGKIGVGEI